MPTFHDVPSDALIDAVAERLADDLEPPAWAAYAKTGTDRELPPEQADFWERRGASLLRKLAIAGPIGVQRLRTEYGGAKEGTNRYRVAPPRSNRASGNVIRTLLQQLEDAGYVETAEGEGRRVTAAGRSLLDETAGDVLDELDDPALERYA